MLREIRSESFRTRVVEFHRGLNVVLGDENATNSIGKSLMLMVVDFAFGGSALLQYNTDLIPELGNHEYDFAFEFDGELHRFKRRTIDPDQVYRCDREYAPVEALSLDGYTALLKHSYAVTLEDFTFRALVGTYMRVWGKENLDPQRPLHAAKGQSGSQCVTDLIKTFGRYGPIKALEEEAKRLDLKQTALNAAVRTQVVPKVGQRQYRDNTVKIAELQRSLDDIKAELAKYATSLSELVNKDVLDLKMEKDRLLALRLTVAGRLRRTERNLSENRHVRSEYFRDLVEFFPEVRQDRLAKIEEFHSGLARVLGAELRESRKELREELERIDAALAEIDRRMGETLKSVNEPTQLVDRVFDVATSLHQARQENERFEGEAELRQALQRAREALAAEKRLVLAGIEGDLNAGMREIVDSVFGRDRKSPQIALRESGYSFEVHEDTGTGTAYAGLIVFDLTVFRTTELPSLVHDSVLFKNIENDSVSRLVGIYASSAKQSFIALDEIQKYGEQTAELLRRQSVIQLSDDAVLYGRDWRRGLQGGPPSAPPPQR